MKIITDESLIDELLTRSIAKILPDQENLKKLLMSGKRLKIYIGADCTGPALHIGHATNLIILEKFRRLGHQVFVLFGDFTARIGDPTDRHAERIQLTEQQVSQNVSDWKKQITPILNFDTKDNPAQIVFNSKWFARMTLANLIGLISQFSAQQMLERDMFKKRMHGQKPVFLHELLYPVMQGYDSLMLDVDIELCGSDQLFNALVGRELVKKHSNKEKFVITTTLLENPITKEKMMSKSQGTGVYLNESPKEMFGKIMSQADENIVQLFTDCTYTTMEEVNKIKECLRTHSLNPRDIKMKLGFEIVSIYHGLEKAKQAQEEFISIFSANKIPKEIPEFKLSRTNSSLLEVLVDSGIIGSKSEVRRLIQQNGIQVNGIICQSEHLLLSSGNIIKIGKLRWLKIVN